MKKILVVLLILAAVMGMSSCMLVNSLFFPYVGEWENIDGDDRMVLNLDVDTYEMISQDKKADGTWADMAAYKGTMVVEEDSMVQTPTHYKIATLNLTTMEFGALPEEWEPVSGLSALPQVGTWAVDGDKLTFTDSDGDNTVFTKI